MALPNLSAEQRAKALERAMAVRRARADVKAQLKRGEVELGTVLVTGMEEVQKMRVLDVVMSMPGMGKVKATALLDVCGISLSRRVGGLGANQRRALLEHFER